MSSNSPFDTVSKKPREGRVQFSEARTNDAARRAGSRTRHPPRQHRPKLLRTCTPSWGRRRDRWQPLPVLGFPPTPGSPSKPTDVRVPMAGSLERSFSPRSPRCSGKRSSHAAPNTPAESVSLFVHTWRDGMPPPVLRLGHLSRDPLLSERHAENERTQKGACLHLLVRPLAFGRPIYCVRLPWS